MDGFELAQGRRKSMLWSPYHNRIRLSLGPAERSGRGNIPTTKAQKPTQRNLIRLMFPSL